MTAQSLGRLERIDLREAWDSEDGDFTPWLAEEANIALLGETIALDLEVEATEQNVGPFRADILCRDTTDGAWVLIENQLEKTDHTHLGQLLTYAAGLEAVTVVWVARTFTEEHRATLDWLNEITDDRFNFFGLEVELWRIGGSPMAPKFNVVSKPNAWTKTAGSAARAMGSQASTATEQLYLEYWSAFRQYAEDHPRVVRPTKAHPQQWMDFSLGKSWFCLSGVASVTAKRVDVNLVLQHPQYAKGHYQQLLAVASEVEAAVGTQLQWRELPNKKQSRVRLSRASDPSDRLDWPAQHEWLWDTLNRFHEVFGPRVRGLVDTLPETADDEALTDDSDVSSEEDA